MPGTTNALHRAAASGNTNLVAILLQETEPKLFGLWNSKKYDINSQDENGNTPLHLAVRSGSLDTVGLLVSSGADISVHNTGRLSPYDLAYEAHNSQIKEVLLKQGSTTLHDAVVKHDLDAVRSAMSDKNIDVNARNAAGYTAFYIAASEGLIDVVQVMIDDPRVDPVKPGKVIHYSPCYQAVTHGHAEVVKILIHHPKIDVNQKLTDDITFLHLAAMHSTDALEVLLQHPKIDPNAITLTERCAPLHIAVGNNKTEAVKVLLSHTTTHIVIQDSRGAPAIYYAVREGYVDILQMLLQAYPANTDSLYPLLRGLLLGAVRLSKQDSLKILLEFAQEKHLAESSEFKQFVLKAIDDSSQAPTLKQMFHDMAVELMASATTTADAASSGTQKDVQVSLTGTTTGTQNTPDALYD